MMLHLAEVWALTALVFFAGAAGGMTVRRLVGASVSGPALPSFGRLSGAIGRFARMPVPAGRGEGRPSSGHGSGGVPAVYAPPLEVGELPRPVRAAMPARAVQRVVPPLPETSPSAARPAAALPAPAPAARTRPEMAERARPDLPERRTLPPPMRPSSAVPPAPPVSATPLEPPATDPAGPSGDAPAVPPAEAAPVPAVVPVPPADPEDEAEPDELTRIRGLGERSAGRLGRLGVTRFDQIAAWSPGDVERFGTELGLGGRIAKEDWVGQAHRLWIERVARQAFERRRLLTERPGQDRDRSQS